MSIIPPAFNCPNCDSECSFLVDDGRDFFVSKGQSPQFRIFYCQQCCIGFSDPCLTDKELEPYYPEDYEAYVPKKSWLGWLQEYKYRNDLRLIKKYIAGKRNLTMLDIGAGRGEFIAAARSFGYSVMGVEPGAAGRRFARDQYGLELQPGFLPDLVVAKPFEVVVIRHVLEHINEAKACLTDIYSRVLAPGGILFIKVPRIDSGEAKLFGRFWHGYDLPRHRVHFSKAGLVVLLKQLGYVDISVRSEVVPFDVWRSIGYFAQAKDRHANSFLFGLAKMFTKLPKLVQVAVAEIIALVLSLGGSGRMIVLARRKD